MKKILLACLFLLIALPVAAAELLMFSNPECKYCQEFLEEVEPTYHESEYAKHLPLKILSMDQRMPIWVARAMDEGRLQPIRNTPTFVVWDEKEIARLVGYGGKESFYESLSIFVEENGKITVKKPEGSRGPMDIWGGRNPPPEGVVQSKDLLDHTYNTPEEALKASKWFGCDGNIHYHKHENVWMPCSMN